MGKAPWRSWAMIAIVAAVGLVKFAPQYSLARSYLWTASALYLIQATPYWVYYIFLYHRFFSPLRHLPTVTEGASWINGQLPTLMKEPSGIPMRRWINTVPNNGLIRYLHMFNNERVFVTSPKALAEVLVTKSYDFVKPELLRLGIGRILGIGILFAEGDEHKMQRKNLAPAFHFRHIKALYPVFWSKSREMVRTIERDVAKQGMPREGKIEIGEWSSRATLDIIGVAGLGQDFNSLAEPDTELNDTYRRIFSPSRSARILGLLQFIFPFWLLSILPLKHNDNIAAASKIARDTSRNLIQLKRERLSKKEEMSPDIISIALESGGFKDENLVDNMMTFLAAGHETTATAMTWAIYMLCQHPEVQTKLRTEIRNTVRSLDDEITSEVIDNMPYLHAVCQEILRFYSPVPLTLRNAATDTSIQGQFIPKGTVIILVPWAVNFSKELWGQDADEFNPERWMAPGQANSGGASSNYAFLTFLHGPRSCIGLRFAVGEMACLLAAFVGSFEFKQTYPDEEVVIKGGITARPRDGMRVDIKAIEGW